MFGFLPSWVSDAMLILAFIAGPTGVIWGILQRKDANRKLLVEESDHDISEFESLTATYKDLLDRANKATDAAVAEVKTSVTQRHQMQGEIDELRESIHDLRGLMRDVLRKHSIQLTQEEQARFDATKPKRRRPAVA